MKTKALNPTIYARTVAELRALVERHGKARIIATIKRLRTPRTV